MSSDDLWRVREKLDGKKSSLSKTYKSSREMHDKVYELNQKMSKHFETLALLYENFEQAYHEKEEAEETFDKEFYSLIERVATCKTRCSDTSAL